MLQINEVLLTDKDVILSEFLRSHTDLLSWMVNGVTHWHFVYLNNNPEKCIYMAGYSENATPKQLRFKEALDSLNKLEYSDLLLLSTYYGHLDTDSLVSKINTPLNPLEDLSYFLLGNISNGYIAYAHQLEHIYSAFSGSTMQEAYRFRKDWNKKLIMPRKKVSEITYNSEMTLADYIAKYSFFDEGPFFLTANFHKAKILFDHIGSNTK